MRLIVARCEVNYSGRLTARLPEALRLLMVKADGSVLVHADAGGYKPLNWMTPPTIIEEEPGLMVVRKLKGDDRLEIRIAEVISDSEHAMDHDAGLEKDGVEAHLQEALAAAPGWCGEGFRLVRREWPTDIGPVDLMCRDEDDGWIAVEIKRIGTIDAVEQLTRYLERIRLDPRWASAAACSPRRWSSRRRASSRRPGASRGWRSTSPCCAASASRRSRCSRRLPALMADEAVLTERRRQRPADHAQPARRAQRRQRALAEGVAAALDRLDDDDDLRSASSPAPARASPPGWTSRRS